MLTKGGFKRDAVLYCCHSLGRADAEHRVQEGEPWWRAWSAILQPLCLGAPNALVALLQAKSLRQGYIIAVRLEILLTGILLDEGATACCCY